MVVDPLDGAVRPQEISGALLPHPRHPGDVVRRIAHQCQIVAHLRCVGEVMLRCHLAGTQAIEAPRAPRRQHMHPFRHQLTVVLVGRHHQHLQIRVRRRESHRQRPDHVVRLVALHLVAPHATRPDDLPDVGEGKGDRLRLLRPLRLVLLVLLAAKGSSRRVEDHRQVLPLCCLQDLVEGVDKSEYGGGVLAPTIEHRTIGEGEVAPIDHREGIDKVESCGSLLSHI